MKARESQVGGDRGLGEEDDEGRVKWGQGCTERAGRRQHTAGARYNEGHGQERVRVGQGAQKPGEVGVRTREEIAGYVRRNGTARGLPAEPSYPETIRYGVCRGSLGNIGTLSRQRARAIRLHASRAAMFVCSHTRSPPRLRFPIVSKIYSEKVARQASETASGAWTLLAGSERAGFNGTRRPTPKVYSTEPDMSASLTFCLSSSKMLYDIVDLTSLLRFQCMPALTANVALGGLPSQQQGPTPSRPLFRATPPGRRAARRVYK